jgi:ABC-type multidrug transport system ATPase subunit
MHQKLIIIQAIAAEADGYFFDEPLNGLDFQSEQIFIEELFNLSKKHKLIVIASHYLEKYSSLPCNVINIVQND